MASKRFVDCKGKYKTKFFECETTIENYVENYVNIPFFDKYCRECESYNKSWECPPNRNNMLEYWKSFDNIKFYAVKLIYDEDFIKEPYTISQLDYIINFTLRCERRIKK